MKDRFNNHIRKILI
ncbi:hypothetical protein CAJAP_10733 [Camponotus japonicus]